jgi:cell division protein FtsW
MGEGSFVNQNQGFARTARQPRSGGPAAGIDWVLIGIVVGLTLFGLLMVYSAGPKNAMQMGNPPDFFLKRQLAWAILGVFAMIATSFIPYHLYRRFSLALMIVSLALLALVAFLGDTTLGATRSFLLGSIRPSELAKIVTIIYVSVWLYAKREVLNDMTMGLFPLIAILGITFGLIFSQPDFSAALTVVMLGGLLFFLAGGEMRQIVMTIGAAGLVGGLLVAFYDTGRTRITAYIGGLQNPLEASYHVQRSLEAIINGKLFGVGIGFSSTKYTGLPVAWTDSIFAVIAEETGLIGAGIIILAFIVLLWRGLQIARRAPDQLGALLASGITIWIVIEALLNMAVMVNLLPHAGNALPFISYGGSSLTITLASVGILMNISRAGVEQNTGTKGGSTFDSVVDLRWRDRRRRIPRPGHPAGTR